MLADEFLSPPGEHAAPPTPVDAAADTTATAADGAGLRVSGLALLIVYTQGGAIFFLVQIAKPKPYKNRNLTS